MNGFSFGELSATAQTRKQVLQRLRRRLKIAERCRFQQRFLVIWGDLRAYKIHLGNGLLQALDYKQAKACRIR